MKLLICQFDPGRRPPREQYRSMVREALEVSFGFKTPVLEYNKYGQPHIQDSKACISYSHSNSLLVLALSNKPIGIDTENRDREAELLEVRGTAFSNSEMSDLDGDLLGTWCLKEAAMKMAGKGLYSNDPNTLSVVRETNNEFSIMNDGASTVIHGQYLTHPHFLHQSLKRGTMFSN